MKRKSSKRIFPKILAFGSLLLAMLFLGTSQASAQSDELYKVPTGDFLTQAQAEPILVAQVDGLRNALKSMTPGTPSYQSTNRKAVFFGTILQSVRDGNEVAQAIAKGTHIFSTVMYGEGTMPEKLAIKQEAVEMLRK